MPNLTAREKHSVSLRLAYMGGYSDAFRKKVAWMLGNGFAEKELLDRSVDDRMMQWVADAVKEYCHANESKKAPKW